jgi:hypothetical protein
LSVYLLVANGSEAIGSYIFGVIATRAGLDMAMFCSAAVLGAVALTVAALPLRDVERRRLHCLPITDGRV